MIMLTIPKDDLVFLLFVAIITAAIYVIQYGRGRRAAAHQIYNDLQLDGYDVKVWPLADPGRGRYVIRIWRNNSWVEVKR